jgi:hypothetical protein
VEELRKSAQYWWLMTIILATWEVEIRRIAFPSQTKQTFHDTHPPISTSGWTQQQKSVIPAMHRSTNMRITVQTNPGIK